MLNRGPAARAAFFVEFGEKCYVGVLEGILLFLAKLRRGWTQ